MTNDTKKPRVDPTNIALRLGILDLDGIAAVNLQEPSPGDLERVVRAYSKLHSAFHELEQKLAEVERERDALCEAQKEMYRNKSDAWMALLKERDHWKVQAEKLAEALADISKTTYGTEFINMDLEEYKSNYEIICRHFFGAQRIARAAYEAFQKAKGE